MTGRLSKRAANDRVPLRRSAIMGLAFAAGMAATQPALAISRIETTKSDCTAIRSTLVREGAAILRYRSKRGLPIYDRYVSDSRLCTVGDVGVWASVPARDTGSCRVIACRADVNDHDDRFIRPRPLLRITH